MVRVKESQIFRQFSARNPPDPDKMELLKFDYNLPSFLPSMFYPISAVPAPTTGNQNSDDKFLELPLPNCDISHPTKNPYPKDLNTIDDASCTPQKRFLIFDQSGNNTRLFFSPSFSPQDQILPAKGSFGKPTARVDQDFSVNPIVEEKWDENHLTDEEGEMGEDSDEINALLYSDSEEGYDTDDDTDDEVTSTGHTSLNTCEECEKDKFFKKHTEEVASSDDSVHKRRKLLDGSCKKSSFMCFDSPLKPVSLCIYEDDVGSSCAGDINPSNDFDSIKREKKVKIREALKILEGIIPGLKSNNPVSIIDKAIVFLKSMKLEAEALKLGKLDTFLP